MEQLSFFEQTWQSADLPPELLEYHPGFFNPAESAALLNTFIDTIPWVQEDIQMYGKIIKTPRLTAWYGDPNKEYIFSGAKHHPILWTDELLMIKEKIEPVSGTRFNSVLLNYYRDANDSVAWHSDDEYELGVNPVIASVSFGQVRRFDIRHKQEHNRKYAIYLENGSLLIMKGDLQHNWVHQIPKSTKPLKERVNLTFRVIN
ncbi:alpha-ketoglutarate-dependent dioxygenase AlkB family protein [Mucilaginibacter sp. McL0603]|uniref:alpha-ketoglutarate-dependent dioxygenase AlkB family protein n=1 Tax=Mucilaginibacter sp. McL0603 TaxID=3415670 RepID=UPI003CF29DB8